MKSLRKKLAVPGALALSACSAPMPVMDAGVDAGTDGGHDAGVDAGFDAGYDAGVPDAGLGPCPVSSPGNPVPGAIGYDDAGERCGCLPFFYFDGGPGEFCDPDIGNPCGIECFNARTPDGGREYYQDDGGVGEYVDGGTPVCFC